MALAKLSTKGWIVIPAEFRRKYGLHPGDQVRIVDYGNALTLMPEFADPISEAQGLLKGETSLVEALLSAREEERLRE
jgi:AbrB family looped-hinge helix DNA binding protein